MIRRAQDAERKLRVALEAITDAVEALCADVIYLPDGKKAGDEHAFKVLNNTLEILDPDGKAREDF